MFTPLQSKSFRSNNVTQEIPMQKKTRTEFITQKKLRRQIVKTKQKHKHIYFECVMFRVLSKVRIFFCVVQTFQELEEI